MALNEGDLDALTPDWRGARDSIIRHLRQGHSVNLVVEPEAPGLELIAQIKKNYLPALGLVDLNDDATISRQGLVSAMLRACGSPTLAPPEPEDLVTFTLELRERPAPAFLALLHFDLVATRKRQYEIDLFAALRDLITEKRKLVLLIHSQRHFIELLPSDHPLSSITDLKTVELPGRS